MRPSTDFPFGPRYDAVWASPVEALGATWSARWRIRRAWALRIALTSTFLVGLVTVSSLVLRSAQPVGHVAATPHSGSSAGAIEVVLLPSGQTSGALTQCPVNSRGTCSCNCTWASIPHACKDDDGSCCHTCCCGGGDPGTTTTAKDDLPEGSEFENLMKQHDSREKGCLCAFDVDRTLTGKPGDLEGCPGNRMVPGTDLEVGVNALTLSSLGQNLHDTFCGRCYLGIVTAGNGSRIEKEELRAQLKGAGGLPNVWSTAANIASPLVEGCPDGEKARCVKDVVAWYMRQAVDVAPSSVYYFDDKDGVVDGFEEYGFNARQVSCASRDASLNNTEGFCGATIDEIVRRPGVFTC